MLKFDRPTLVTITAPTCSGKSYLMGALEQILGFTRIVSTTTRPIRTGEVEGKDYYFISEHESYCLEAAREFAELIEFRGVRYGVTHEEMNGKMNGSTPPMVILEPQGLAAYKKICAQNNWDVYTVYVSTVESERIKRLNFRTAAELQKLAVDQYEAREKSITNRGNTFDKLEAIVARHTDRLLSITTEERGWSNTTIWDAIVPGDNVKTALEYIKQGVQYRNQRVAPPMPYEHVPPQDC